MRRPLVDFSSPVTLNNVWPKDVHRSVGVDGHTDLSDVCVDFTIFKSGNRSEKLPFSLLIFYVNYQRSAYKSSADIWQEQGQGIEHGTLGTNFQYQ